MKGRQAMLAVFAVAFMMMSPFIMTVSDADTSASTLTGSYTMFVNDGTGWDHDVGNDYDAAQALMTTKFWKAGDSMEPKTEGTTWVQPNPDYGDLQTFDGKVETVDVKWHVYTLVDGIWEPADDRIGWFTCYSDQPSAWKTANLAFVYGDNSTASTNMDLIQDYIDENGVDYSEIVNVMGNSAFLNTFYLKVDPRYEVPAVSDELEAELHQGKTVTGYGSTAYLALKVAAVGTNLVGVDSIPGNHIQNQYSDYWEFNGWMESLYGLGTVQTQGQETQDWADDSYAYWKIYTDYTSVTNNTEAAFVLGQYGPLTCCDSFADNSFTLIYNEFPM